jgi:hypothetical protein
MLFFQTLESGRNLGKQDDRVSEVPKYVFVNHSGALALPSSPQSQARHRWVWILL